MSGLFCTIEATQPESWSNSLLIFHHQQHNFGMSVVVL